ncbi:putative membrane protein (TIGR02226 family) [Chitinophaga niastensis]|uniref:Putative membrane protein (TIGR02226 family) n=1 Tax=Chitinophaga niastensis TaxID=536980 RepID=A0A2P8HJ72_CHINA|nr:BatA domain-containing protein [Chitinophaga niastensis]PSL46230.1 putative membrane protein (TIGR02226 family) [Chitinophaga niastensis]
MLHLLQPIWMLMTAGISIPVFIHLWHQRPGKVLKIGSIQLLQAASLRHARSWRISEWWLLLLRCLLILLLAFLLSKPVWQQPLTTRTQKGWVLMEPAAYPRFQPIIDSLLQTGYQLHTFDTAFSKTFIKELSSSDTVQMPYWQTLQYLPKKVPADFPVYLFTGNRLERFQGNRPTLALNLHWYTYTPADSVSNWNAYTYSLRDDSIRIVKGYSSPGGTAYHDRDTIAAMDTAAVRITIYADKYTGDARYLYAAMKAVQQYTQRKIIITTVQQIRQLPASQDWLWWLSDQPIPVSVKTSHQVKYATGKATTQTSLIAGTTIPVYKIIPTDDTTTALWKDGYGQILLTNNYTLYTHLNPAWNGMVWSEAFPGRLLQLLFPAEQDRIHDRRAIDPRQLQPLLVSGKEASAVLMQEDINLDKICWLLLLLVFCLERYLSLRQKKEVDNA